MSHWFVLPVLPLTVVGAILFKRKAFAYGLPVLLVLYRVLTTVPSPIFLFTGGSLLASVFLIRRLRSLWGEGFWALAAYAALAVVSYDLIANLGVWVIGGCVPGKPPLYPYTVKGLAQCYLAGLPYAGIRLVRDIPLTILFVKGVQSLAKLDASRIGSWVQEILAREKR